MPTTILKHLFYLPGYVIRFVWTIWIIIGGYKKMDWGDGVKYLASWTELGLAIYSLLGWIAIAWLVAAGGSHRHENMTRPPEYVPASLTTNETLMPMREAQPIQPAKEAAKVEQPASVEAALPAAQPEAPAAQAQATEAPTAESVPPAEVHETTETHAAPPVSVPEPTLPRESMP